MTAIHLLTVAGLRRGGATGSITDNFNGTYPARSDAGSWTLLNGTAPVNAAGKLTPGAASGSIAAVLGHQNSTYSVDVNTTVGTFTPLMRLCSDGSATTNYIGIAIDTAANAAAFGVSIFSHSAGNFVGLGTSSVAVFTSGTAGTLSVIVTNLPGSPLFQIKFNGTTITGLDTGNIAGGSAAGVAGTYAGIDVPAAGVNFDNYSAT